MRIFSESLTIIFVLSVEVSKKWEAEVRMFSIFAHRRAAIYTSTNNVTLRTAAYDPYPEMKMKIGKIDHNLNLDLGPSDVRVCVLMLQYVAFQQSGVVLQVLPASSVTCLSSLWLKLL